MWYKNIAGRFFRLVTKHACDGQTGGRTDGQNYDSQDRASIARAVKTVIKSVMGGRPSLASRVPENHLAPGGHGPSTSSGSAWCSQTTGCMVRSELTELRTSPMHALGLVAQLTLLPNLTRSYALQWARHSPTGAPSRWGICTPSNTWFLGPTHVHNPNGISIGSSVSEGLTTDRPTDRSRYSVCNNRPHRRDCGLST